MASKAAVGVLSLFYVLIIVTLKYRCLLFHHSNGIIMIDLSTDLTYWSSSHVLAHTPSFSKYFERF